MMNPRAAFALLAAALLACTGGVSEPPSNVVGDDAGAPGAGGDGGGGGSGGGGGDGGSQSDAGRPDAGRPDAGAPDAGGGTPDAGGGGGGGGLIPADRTTRWNPGILADVPLGLPLGADGLPQRTTVCKTVNPGESIQAAIDACPDNQVVLLAPGTFTITSTVQVRSKVVLRGSGSGTGGTTIVKSNGGTVLAIGTERDQVCYGNNVQAVALTADAAKDSTTLSVGSAAASFHVGDLIVVDQVDASPVVIGDCQYYKRGSSGSYRSIAQAVQVTAVNAGAGTLGLGAALHWAYKAGSPTFAQAFRLSNSPTVSWAGIESLRIQGGSMGSYDGQSAGGIDIANAAFCWVKDVQTDQTIGGMHVRLGAAYRCVVRDGNFHHSADYGYAKDCYGVVLSCFSADNLVENNIVRYMNKPVLMMVSGGGNVIGYNYVDNSWAEGDWQELNVDSHCAFSHMELIEGNLAPHMGAANTHGNAGYFTFFRNYASTQFASPEIATSSTPRASNVTAIELQGGDVGMNVVGNVLGKAGVTQVYDQYSNVTPPSVYELGQGSPGAGQSDVAVTSLLRTGNYDFFHQSTQWTAGAQTLPPSLYLSGKPSWWPAGTAWPWAGPDLNPMVQTLPAKARSDGL